ncbi:MAG: zf-HC2 domain-containing protein [Acidobacteriota bacterium]
MALEQHNTAVEFETMLRSHLSRGGSMVEACGGFDADTASAYLEGALGQMTRSRYDAHLAGCPSCRRSVIDLSRLIYSSQPTLGEVEQAEPQTTPVITSSGEVSSWKTVVAGWLGLSEWNLATRNWGLATAGAVGALLLAIMATQLWRQPKQPLQGAAGVAAATGDQSNVSLAASPTPAETVVLNETGSQEQQSLAPSTVPPPTRVGPAQSDQIIATNLPGKTEVGKVANSEIVTLFPTVGNSIELPPPAPSPSIRPVLTSGFAGGQAVNFTPLVESKQPVAPPEAPSEVANARILAPLNPSPGDNPMGGAQKPQPTSNVFNRAFAFVPSRKDGAERKPEMSEIEEGAPKLLAIRVRDKVFNFRGGMWIDQAYKVDMAWRITKLVQDSDDYKRVLADEPQLKDFFERGSVIVVWKNKIYKVVSK